MQVVEDFMAFDFKKEYKEFYLPPRKPGIIAVPPMNYIAVRGAGNPNEEQSEYQDSIGLLYGIAFTSKMSYKGSHKINGYYEYVVPPLEGFWWQEAGKLGVDYASKDTFQFLSVIRLPEFVTPQELDWAIAEATNKKQQDFSKVQWMTIDEGLCVQCMHLGPYDAEPATIEAMHACARQNGFEPDPSNSRLHHEIYLSDPRCTVPSKLKTVIRHPIRPI